MIITVASEKLDIQGYVCLKIGDEALDPQTLDEFEEEIGLDVKKFINFVKTQQLAGKCDLSCSKVDWLEKFLEWKGDTR